MDAPYPSFLIKPLLPEQPVAVTSNFAVLNLIDDLSRLFDALATQLQPGGLVIASVLNPFFLGDAKYRWWWRGLPTLVTRGSFRLPGKEADTFRYTRRAIRAAARHHFLEVDPTRPPPYQRRTGWLARFLFVVLRLDR